MYLEYVAHSCFLIETNGQRLAFDPWITPTAYNKQWFLFPRPHNISHVVNADVVIFSHGHEDHFNAESLELINKKAIVYFPFQWRSGIKGYLNHKGFEQIIEAISFKTYTVGDTKITYLGYSLESVVVLECEGMVLVNINDALNSNHETAVSFLLKKIVTLWPRIDFLLSGWSGAGYFPNNVHYPGKDDREVARIREQYFAHNFCKFAHYLQPDFAIAFAPGFVLLHEENRWINEIKFPREELAAYYHANFEASTAMHFPLMYPGDFFINKKLTRISAYHEQHCERDLYSNLDSIFSAEIAEVNTVAYVSQTQVDQLIIQLKHWLAKNKSIYSPEVISDVVFSILLVDSCYKLYLNIRYNNQLPLVEMSTQPTADARLIIRVKTSLLLINFAKEWGGDLLSIGYGIQVDVFDELSLEKNLDIVCVRLISRFPRFRNDIANNISRIAKYYFSNPALAQLWLQQKLKLRPYINKFPFNERDHWITYNKCELCKVCNMPEVIFGKT